MARKVQTAKSGGNVSRQAKPRGVRTDDEAQLWSHVRDACEEEFARRFGIRWEDSLVKLPRDRLLEEEARDIHARLRSALNETARFLARPETRKVAPPGPALRLLLDHVPQVIVPLLRQSWLQPSPWPPSPEPRTALVVSLDTYNHFMLAPRANGSSRFLTVREMAVISLLIGNKPSLSAGPLSYTAADVIKLETQYIRPLVKKHGAAIDPKNRGPSNERDERGAAEGAEGEGSS